MRSAIAFLTIAGRPAAPSPTALPWFPVVGALLGVAVGGVWVGAGHVWPAAVAAAVALVTDALLTGGLHWDGVADTGDGLLPALPTERRLAAMADPQIGAFGVVTVVAVFLLRFATLAAGPARAWVLAGLWCLSRACIGAVALLGRYARTEGLASGFRDATSSARSKAALVAGIGLAISLPLALIDRPGHGLAALGAEVATVALLTWFSARRIGGYTGDVLGAQIVLAETAGLLLWSARW
jgi:adenosylcobinamide-GDP ribazoletransferase